MMNKEQLSEELLEGWLSMCLSVVNERLVSAMTFNESMVCNLLYHRLREGGPLLTATDLCRKLQILKPQMNVILGRLEGRGLICRSRSEVDRRNVNLELTEEGVAVYEKAHREILRLPEGMIDRLGEEKALQFAGMMKEMSACFDQMMEEQKESGQKASGKRRVQ